MVTGMMRIVCRAVIAVVAALSMLLLTSAGASAASSHAAFTGAAAASSHAPFTETPVPSLAPDAAEVPESYVSLYDPLPASDGPHPAACDRIGYLRFRSAGGPARSAQADAVFVAQPGIFEGPAAFDQVARHTIEAAAARGYHVEFWALNPRPNCLVDSTGVEAAEAAENPSVALGYYFDGIPIDGRTFAGFTSEQSAAWLSDDGLAQTLKDEYTIISRLPPAFRSTRVFCGGHSLGGTVTAAFADWDFSGIRNPADAGYSQCAGYFSLDTRLELSPGGLTAMLSPAAGLPGDLAAAATAGKPYVDAPPITPQTLQALPILGIGSYFSPSAQTTFFASLPDDSTFDSTLDLLFAADWTDYLGDTPNPRAFNMTNQAALGFTFGDVSEPIGILRASLGVPTGGPVVEKTFPVPYGTPAKLLDTVGGNDLIAPAPTSATTTGPLYSWLNYDQVPSPGPSPSDDPGDPYTSAASEVTDITQFSRALFDAGGEPFDEEYFPTRLLTDLSEAGEGVRTGSLADLAYSDGIAIRPAVYVDASEGLAPLLGAVPAGTAPQVHVTANGYNHLDVLTAASSQTDGQPEITSSTLTSWMAQVLGAPLAEPSHRAGEK